MAGGSSEYIYAVGIVLIWKTHMMHTSCCVCIAALYVHTIYTHGMYIYKLTVYKITSSVVTAETCPVSVLPSFGEVQLPTPVTT